MLRRLMDAGFQFRASVSMVSLRSPSMQTDLSRISGGAYASLRLTQAYLAFSVPKVICQKGYLMIPGVFLPTPSSRKCALPP